MSPIKNLWLLAAGVIFLPSLLFAQNNGDTSSGFSLEECIRYAMESRPAVEQAKIDEAIGEREINAQLSEWLPQVSAQFNAVHNLKPQIFALGDRLVKGRSNTSNLLLQANQTLYNNDVLLASRAARFRRLQLDQGTADTKITTITEVSKAFYDVLLTREQLRILDENISRLEKQHQDARNRYESGLADKTDYQRAGIALANTRSDRNRAQEIIGAKEAYLKQLIGYPVESALELEYDYELMQEQIFIDTTQLVEFNNRIEYQLLKTQRQLLELNTSYHRWGFLPTVSGFYNYNFMYFGDHFSELYNTAHPVSAVGINVALPVFQGTRRIQNLRRAQLLEERLDLESENLELVINTQYQTALANYKSDLYEWQTLERNVEVAGEVYNIIKLQYDEGIKTYLDLIIAETDLRAAQLNFYNALFQVLESKLDLQKALGTIEVN